MIFSRTAQLTVKADIPPRAATELCDAHADTPCALRQSVDRLDGKGLFPPLDHLHAQALGRWGYVRILLRMGPGGGVAKQTCGPRTGRSVGGGKQV